MIFGIDCFTVQTNGESVTFVRVGDTLGWYSHVNGNRHGDYITSDDPIKDNDDVVERLEILCDQAAQTIGELKKMGSITRNDLMAGLREQVRKAAL